MTTKHFNFDQINRAKWNPRVDLKPSDPEYQAIHGSLKKYGFLGGGVVNVRKGKNTLIGGHQRVTIMQDMGQTGADFATVSLNDQEEKKLNLILNRVTGRWSAPDLTALLRELQAEQIDLAGLGFHNPAELNALLTGAPKVTKRDPDDAPRAPDDSKALTKTGDLYDLHTEHCHHRVMCGDSTSAKDMEKLFRVENICPCCGEDNGTV